MRVSDMPGSGESRLTLRVASRVSSISLVLFCVAAALFLAALVENRPERVPVGISVCGVATAFALASLAVASIRDRGWSKVFWIALAGGVLFRAAGDARWAGARLSVFSPAALEVHDAAYVISYLLFLAALLWLAAKTAGRITFVAALDAFAVMLSSGLVSWYFFLDPVADLIGLENWPEPAMTLSLPVSAAGFLFLTLTVLSTSRRPPFAGLLAVAFASLLVADLLYLKIRSSGPYEPGTGRSCSGL